ncbi:hypothetical protein E2C01_002098 [Portunus trituberculatus]|uniref:Uncharacterized protein n=1 Tax=Portunus trituberculatus TaxID=210409 RepID=A0A5B7CM90_PORTR|nr:hypothetical protein [Portunus trituberculatus]
MKDKARNGSPPPHPPLCNDMVVVVVMVVLLLGLHTNAIPNVPKNIRVAGWCEMQDRMILTAQSVASYFLAPVGLNLI